MHCPGADWPPVMESSDSFDFAQTTAILLAGGKSERMRTDKSLLPVHGMPLIQHILEQLRPHFDEIIVSANDADKYAFLGVPIVPDKLPGQGPMGGILATLGASAHDLNFVMACDIPEVDLAVVQRLMIEARDADAAVPITEGGRLEPLFAVYRKTMIPVLEQCLRAGVRRIRDAFDRCNVHYVELGEASWLRNLNTPEEYADFESRERPAASVPSVGAARIHFEGEAWVFDAPHRIVEAHTVEEVRPALEEVESAVNAGAWAVGFLAYEAAPAFDTALTTHASGGFPRRSHLQMGPEWGKGSHLEMGPTRMSKEIDPPAFPLLWFGLYAGPSGIPPAPCGEYAVGAWEPLISQAEYVRSIERIHAHLAAGDTYQVNYTFPMRASFQGDAQAWFRQLCAAQGCGYFAYIDTGRFQILSASPELFFSLDGTELVTRPMKGTCRRGRWLEEDRALASELLGSEKERAENLMIVDLLRNDMGRISETGSVVVPRLFEAERYETLWQMTSTITSRCHASMPEILGAMFPSGSVTGAPKAETMKIIRQLEPHPRGVYCGAVGYIAPNRRACFNVAIRTATIDSERGTADYHVGGGITWDAAAGPEYVECLQKAAILTHRRPEFSLLESLCYEDGYFLIDAHLERLLASAEYFGRPADEAAIRRALLEYAGQIHEVPAKVRCLLDVQGRIHIEHAALTAPHPWRVGLAKEPVSSADVFLFHKTTHRAVYDRSLAARPECNDVILWNERGELTESTMANVVLEIEGRKCTPPVECGLLAGTFRYHLLQNGEIEEARLTKDDLRRANRVWLINSVRKWIETEWVE